MIKTKRKTWVYFILNAANQSIIWDSFSQKPVINSPAAPVFIPQNPAGWYDIEISAATNLKYFSLNRQFITNLKFVNDAANILRWFNYNVRGYDNDLYILIQQWNRSTDVYETAYKGKLDYTIIKDLVESGVTISTKEGGILEYLNSNDGIAYEILCDENNAAIQYVNFPFGINLQDTYNYTFVEADLDGAPAVIPFAFLNNEGDSVGVVYGNPIYEPIAGDIGDYFIGSTNYIVSNSTGAAKTFHFAGTLMLNGINTDGNTGQYKLFTQIANDTAMVSLNNDFITILFPAGATSVPFEFDITLQVGEKLFISHQNIFTSPGISGGLISYLTSPLKITFVSATAPSKAFCLTWYEWYKQMIVKLSDGKYTGESVYLKSRPDLVVTCGDALRNTDRTIVPDYNIASTFSDGFKSMSSILDLALNIIDGVLYIEPKTIIYAADPATQPKIFELGEISDVVIEPATDLLINDIECGFPDQDYDQRNGKYEFNSEQEWKAPVTLTTQNKFDIRSVWRGDAFGIEFIRGNLTKLDTTDNAGDKEPFMIQVRSLNLPNLIEATVIKGAETFVPSGLISYGNINFFGGGENFIAADGTLQNFTYIKLQPHTVQINANIYGNISGTGTATFDLQINGISIAQRIVNATEHFFKIDFAASEAMNQNDIINILLTHDAGVSIDINSAGIDLLVIGANAIQTFDVWRDIYSEISGVLDATVYNVNFSPHRQLLNHAAYLSGLLNQMQMDSLKLTSSAKNVELSTTLNGVTITEKEDIVVNSLLPALFLPYYITFKFRPQYTFSKIITQISGGYIHATLNGNELFMIPFGEMQAKPANVEVQEWKLLLAPNNILTNLLKLSQAGLFLDYMDNLIFISDLNPVHFVKYDYEPDAKYHHLDLYDEWVRKRNERFAVNPNYIQRWQLGDNIELQFITANLGALQIDVKDCNGNTVETIVTSQITDAAVQPPYILQQASITGLPVGNYYIVLSYAGIILAISEMQKVSEIEKAYLYEYFSTYNVLYGYFSNWRPKLRCDSMLMQWQPISDFENYEDDPWDEELINARANKFRQLILGTNDGIGGSGLPDFMMIKMNHILLLNQWYVEGEHYVRQAESKLEPTQRSGNPFDFYTVPVMKAKNEFGLSISGVGETTVNGIISYTFDATGFGMQAGILTLEIEDES